jgi:outer membrane protein TolC
MTLYAKLFFVFIVVVTCRCCSAQESMMQNVDNAYLDKLIKTAKANYPKRKTYDHEVDIAHANLQKAKLDWFNILSLSYYPFPAAAGSAASANGVNGYQYGFTANVGSLLQKPSEVKAARGALEIAQLNQSEYDLNLTALVQQRYYTYLSQLTMLNWTTKSLETAESSLNDIKYRFEKGMDTYETYNKALAYYTSVIQMKIKNEADFLIAKSALEEIIGAKLETVK